jgi:hypothetical protein
VFRGKKKGLSETLGRLEKGSNVFQLLKVELTSVFDRIEGRNAPKLVFFSCTWNRFLGSAQGAVGCRKNCSSWKLGKSAFYTSGTSRIARTKEQEPESKLQSMSPLQRRKVVPSSFSFLSACRHIHLLSDGKEKCTGTIRVLC